MIIVVTQPKHKTQPKHFHNAHCVHCTTSTEHIYLQIDHRSTVSDLLSQPARLWEGLILILYSSFILFTNSSHYSACQTLGRVDFDYGVIIFIDYLISMFCIAVVVVVYCASTMFSFKLCLMRRL